MDLRRPLALLPPTAVLLPLLSAGAGAATTAAATGAPAVVLQAGQLLLLALPLTLLKTLVLKQRLNPSWGRALGVAALGNLLSLPVALPPTLALFSALAPPSGLHSSGDLALGALVLAFCALYFLLCWPIESLAARTLLRAHVRERRPVTSTVFRANALAFTFAVTLLLLPFIAKLLLG